MILWMNATLATSQNWAKKKKKTSLEAVFLLLTNFRPQKYDFNLYKRILDGKNMTQICQMIKKVFSKNHQILTIMSSR
jgi:hypothetical protein